MDHRGWHQRAAPLVTGIAAVMSQSCPLGFVNPALYQAATSPGTTLAFNAITSSNNDFGNLNNGSYPANGRLRPGVGPGKSHRHRALGPPVPDGAIDDHVH